MKILKTTKEKPYIEFRFNKRGDLKFAVTSDWWGGINEGFYCSDGTCGNTCHPKDLDRYVISFKKRKIKDIKRKIAILQKQLDKIK